MPGSRLTKQTWEDLGRDDWMTCEGGVAACLLLIKDDDFIHCSILFTYSFITKHTSTLQTESLLISIIYRNKFIKQYKKEMVRKNLRQN